MLKIMGKKIYLQFFLIWVCTVCLCPANMMLGLYGLKGATLKVKNLLPEGAFIFGFWSGEDDD